MNKRQKKKFDKKFRKKKYYKPALYILPVDSTRVMLTYKLKRGFLGYDFVDLEKYIETNGESFICSVDCISQTVNKPIKWYIDTVYKKEDK